MRLIEPRIVSATAPARFWFALPLLGAAACRPRFPRRSGDEGAARADPILRTCDGRPLSRRYNLSPDFAREARQIRTGTRTSSSSASGKTHRYAVRRTPSTPPPIPAMNATTATPIKPLSLPGEIPNKSMSSRTPSSSLSRTTQRGPNEVYSLRLRRFSITARRAFAETSRYRQVVHLGPLWMPHTSRVRAATGQSPHRSSPKWKDIAPSLVTNLGQPDRRPSMCRSDCETSWEWEAAHSATASLRDSSSAKRRSRASWAGRRVLEPPVEAPLQARSRGSIPAADPAVAAVRSAAAPLHRSPPATMGIGAREWRMTPGRARGSAPLGALSGGCGNTRSNSACGPVVQRQVEQTHGTYPPRCRAPSVAHHASRHGHPPRPKARTLRRPTPTPTSRIPAQTPMESVRSHQTSRGHDPDATANTEPPMAHPQPRQHNGESPPPILEPHRPTEHHPPNPAAERPSSPHADDTLAG